MTPDTIPATPTGANARQVAGNHYAAAIQHWDMVVKYHVPYLEAQYSRYVVRCHKKAKRVDLEKACHFAEKLVEVQSVGWIKEMSSMFRNWFYPKALTAIGTTDGYYEVREFAHANGCDEKQMLLVWMALAGSSPARLLQYTRDYMHECYPQEEDPPAVARWYAPSERIIVHRPVTGEPRLLNGDGSPGPGYVNQDR